MADKEILLAMLDRAGIPFEQGAGPGDRSGITITVPSLFEKTPDSPVIGYTGFITTIHFDGEGELTQIGVWE